MKHAYRKLAGPVLAAILATTQLVFVPAAAASSFEHATSPSGGAMLADAVMIRPVMLVGSAAGVVAFIVTLPFSALGGNVGEAADELVMKPVKYTFVRPLGEI